MTKTLGTSRNPAVLFALGSAAVGYQLNVLVPILPTLQEALGNSLAETSWVLTACLLAAGASLPIVGRCGDIWDKVDVYRVVLITGLLGSLISLTASTLTQLIVGRVLQGISLGAVSLGMSTAHDRLPEEMRAKSITLIGSSFGLGSALSLPLGAFITSSTRWQFVFIVPVILLLPPLLLLRRGEVQAKLNRPKLDVAGAFLLAVSLVLLLYAIFTLSSPERNLPLTLGTFLASVITMMIWVFHERRTPHPLIALDVLIERNLWRCSAASFYISLALFSYSVLIPQMFRGDSRIVNDPPPEVQVALILMPTGILMFFISRPVGRFISARGARRSFAVGVAIAMSGFAASLLLAPSLGYFLLVSLLLGLGSAFSYSAMTMLSIELSPAEKSGESSAVNALIQTLGASLGGALSSTLLSAGDRLPITLTNENNFRLSFFCCLIVLLLAFRSLQRIKKN